MLGKLALVTFPVDYGSVTLQNNFLSMLRGRSDVNHYVFSPSETSSAGAQISSIQRGVSRLKEMLALRRICESAKKDHRTVIFQQISPVLFSAPFLRGVNSYVFLDWTRKLYEPITHKKMSSNAVTRLHSIALNSVSGVLAFTDAAATSVRQDYHVPGARIHRIPMPFDVLGTRPTAPNSNGPLKLLFVGGDFHRKGGEALVRWFQNHSGSAVELTIMTQTQVALPPSVRLIRNDAKESAKTYLGDYDLFVLPTKYDAFPLAIGEAASAGLGIVTSRNALGAREVVEDGINGYIVDNDEQLFARLSELAEHRQAVEGFKVNSRKKMVNNFTYDRVIESLASVIGAGN